MKQEDSYRFEVKDRLSPKSAAEEAARVNGKIGLVVVETAYKRDTPKGRTQSWGHNYFIAFTSINGSTAPIVAVPLGGLEITTGGHNSLFVPQNQIIGDTQQQYSNRAEAWGIAHEFEVLTRSFGVIAETSEKVVSIAVDKAVPAVLEIPHYYFA